MRLLAIEAGEPGLEWPDPNGLQGDTGNVIDAGAVAIAYVNPVAVVNVKGVAFPIVTGCVTFD